MQTKTEHLLILLMEEAGEVISSLAQIQHAAAKALRFGLNEFHCEHPETNNTIDLQKAFESLNMELSDLDAIRSMLDKEGALYTEPIKVSEILCNLKLEKVEHFMGVSRDLGILEKEHWCKHFIPDTLKSRWCNNPNCADTNTCSISANNKEEPPHENT